MKKDYKGCSVCANGEENTEHFTVDFGGKGAKEKVQYDYRHTDGELFSCIADNIEQAREKCDNWLKNK